jgi:predicted HTH domain antitoxin
MAVTISDEIIQAAHLTATDIKRELAILLFQQDRLTLAQAAALADMPWIAFQHLLASREISPHYDVAEFEQDLVTLQQMETR